MLDDVGRSTHTEDLQGGDGRPKADRKFMQDNMRKRTADAVAFPASTKLFHPQADWRKSWDLGMMGLLIFSALVTPFELAFLDNGDCGTVCCSPPMCLMWAVNQLVTILFIIDIHIIFNTAFFSQTQGKWIVDRQSVAVEYLKTWFFVDVISVIPFEYIGPYLSDDPDNLKALALIRLVRLLRLLKLLRILKGFRILDRWQNKLAIPFSSQVLYKSITLTVLMCHWSACAIRLVAQTSRQSCRDDCYFRVYAKCVSSNPMPEDWPMPDPTSSSCYYRFGGLQNFTSYQSTDNTTQAVIARSNVERYCAQKCLSSNWLDRSGFPDSSTTAQYIAAFYWGIYNLKGCDAFAISVAEYAVAIFVMIAGGGVWMLLLGDMCNVLGNLDVAGNTYRKNMDNLNQYLADNHFHKRLVVRLRAYFIHCKDLLVNEFYKATLLRMSPTLRSQVAHHEHGSWVKKIVFFAKAPKLERRDLVADLAVNFVPMVYVPGDNLVQMGSMNKSMIVIHKGLAMKSAPPALPAFLASSSVVGEDVLLRTITDKRQQRKYSVTAMTYCDVLEITARQLLVILTSGVYPDTYKSIRRYALRLYLRRSMPIVLKEAMENPAVHDFHDVAMLLTGELVNEVDVAVQQAEDEDDMGIPPEQMLKLMGKFDELDRNYRIMGHRMKAAAKEIRHLRKQLYKFLKSRGLIQSSKSSHFDVETTFDVKEKEEKGPEKRLLIPRKKWRDYCRKEAKKYARQHELDALIPQLDEVAERADKLSTFSSITIPNKNLESELRQAEKEIRVVQNRQRGLVANIQEETKRLRRLKEHQKDEERKRNLARSRLAS